MNKNATFCVKGLCMCICVCVVCFFIVNPEKYYRLHIFSGIDKKRKPNTGNFGVLGYC